METKPTLVSEADAGLLNSDDATRLLLNLADAVPAVIAHVDDQLCYRFVNKTYERWWMLSRSEVVGRPIKSILGPAFATIEENLKAGLAGKPQSFEFSFDFPDGRFRTVRMEYAPHRSADGKVLGLFVLGFDISEMQKSRERLEDAQRLANMGSFELDVKTGETFRSDAAHRLFGRTVETMEPGYDGFLKCVHPDDRDRVGANFDKTLAGRDGHQSEFRITLPSGEVRNISQIIRVKKGADGKARTVSGTVQDITKIRETEERFRLLLETTHVIPWEADAETWLFTYVGPQAVELLGYPSEQWLEKDFWINHIHPDDKSWVMEYCQKSSEDRDNYEFEYRFIAKDGRTVWLNDIVKVVRKNGKPIGLKGFMIDISEEKLSHERLKKSERRLKGLLESSADAIISIDQSGTITHFSRSAEKMLGYTENETLGKNVSFLMPEPHKSEHHGYIKSYLRTGKSKILGVGPRELKARHKDGSIIPVELTIGEIDDDSGPSFVGHLRDISLRKKTLETLHDVGARLINIVETERKRIARELHDDLSQELALIAVELDLLGMELPKRRSSIEQQLKRIQGMAKNAASAVHEMSHQLHPAMLDQLGLASAVASYCNETSSRQETRVEFTDEGISRDVPADVSLNFYRILQEGIQNSLKHSGADKIEVKLYPDGKNICMTVSDEGLGFDPDSATGLGLGLTSIEERARLIGANLEISSQPGKGTKIRVCKLLKQET